MPTPMSSRFEDALVFTAQLHREQWRKGSNVPYVSHLVAGAALVIEHRGDEDEATAVKLTRLRLGHPNPGFQPSLCHTPEA